MPSVRDRSAGRPDVGQRVTKLKQGRDALIRDRRVGQKDVRQRVPMLTCGYDALIRDRRVGHTGGGWTTSTNAALRLWCLHPLPLRWSTRCWATSEAIEPMP